MTLDLNTKNYIQDDMYRIETILNTNIFNFEGIHPLTKSAFIEILICLRDLMYKAEKFSTRISFSDDIVTTKKLVDVSDLIKFVRDSLCHIESTNHFISGTQIKATFNGAKGKRQFLV